MNQIFVFAQISQVELLASSGTVSGDGPYGRYLVLDEIMRVGPDLIEFMPL